MNLTRRATRLALVLSAVSAVPAFAQGAPTSGPPKIAYIDSKVVLSRAPGRKEAEDTFNKEMEVSRAQVQKMGDSLQTMIADYQKSQSTLAATVREQREAAIRKKQEDYQSRAGALDQQMQQRQMELVKPIMTVSISLICLSYVGIITRAVAGSGSIGRAGFLGVLFITAAITVRETALSRASPAAG